MTSTLSPMNPERRAAVRAVLVEHAAASQQPVTHRASRMRAQQSRPAVQRGAPLGLASAVAMVTTVAVLVSADPAVAPSYASWTAVPSTAPGGTASGGTASDEDIKTWSSKCTDLKVGGIGIEGVGERREDAAKRKALVDRRGDFTYCVDISLGSGTPTDPFIALSGIRADGLNASWGSHTDQVVQPPAAGEIVVVGGDDRPLPEDEPGIKSLRAYQLFGMAGPGVTGVDIVLSNGLRITASIQDGIWGAWWPEERGGPADVRIDIHTRSGIRTLPAESLRMR